MPDDTVNAGDLLFAVKADAVTLFNVKVFELSPSKFTLVVILLKVASPEFSINLEYFTFLNTPPVTLTTPVDSFTIAVA